MATVGKNILDNLTTGMYSDSKVIYREYIQNACDQIDLAIQLGILASNEGFVDIYIDNKKRYISIKDNATGVKSANFVEDVGDIANSNKEIGKNKGFRGIGSLCGLAYCKTLVFTTSYKGEAVKSIMTCDAEKMRSMLVENKKYSLDEVWDEIVSYRTESEVEDEHYFEVELIGVNKENTDLLDQNKVRNYLSFVVPVPYSNKFILRNQIYGFAKKLGVHIDEYRVLVNGAQVFKEYTTKLKEKSGSNYKNYDEITKLEFKEFRNGDDELIAWMWYGISCFDKQIPDINPMRGIRVRSSNIQLGGDDTLEPLFKEKRGNYYFVGEVFAVDKKLIPNSQRDYFNENESRVLFEDLLREYFYDVLHNLYYQANRMKNDYKRQAEYIAVVEKYKKKEKEQSFVDEKERHQLRLEVETAKKKAEEARKHLGKINVGTEDSPIAEIKRGIERKYNGGSMTKKAENTELSEDTPSNKKESYITSNMSKLSKRERKLVSKILSIIDDLAPKDVAEEIIEKIKEELK